MAGRRGIRTIVVCMVFGAMAVGATQAQAAKIPTDFADHQLDCGWAPPECLYYGQISSPKEKCIRGRKVQIFRLLMNTERQLVDTDKTTRHGNYAGLGLSSQVSAYKVKVLPKRVGDDRCRGVSYIGV